jgi:hypothetical protein
MSVKILGADIDTASTNAATWMAELDPLTSASIIGYSVGEKFGEDASFLGDAGSEIENMANIVAKIDHPDPKKTHTFRIPAADIGIFVATSGPNKNVVDGLNADVVAFLGLYETTGAIAQISDGETLVDSAVGPPVVAPFVRGKRRHRGSKVG